MTLFETFSGEEVKNLEDPTTALRNAGYRAAIDAQDCSCVFQG